MSRNANLDVFRCFAMFAIVLCHVYQHDKTIVSATPARDFLFLNLIRWNVDAFLALSGWFGMKFSLKKFGKLWGFVAFYSAISIVVGRFIMGVATPIKIDGEWFGNAYLCLLLIVPYEPSCFGRIFHRVPLQFLVERGFSPELAILIAAVACFVICFLLDLVRRYSLRGIMRFRGFEVEWLKRWA